VRSRGCRFWLAFDGDGDRVVFVSNSYGTIETEKLVCLFFLMLIEKNNNRNNLVVTTKISNFSLRKNLTNLGGELVEVEVGDRFVIQEVEKTNALFGCEPSGHYYFPNETKSMDGFVTALKFIELVSFYDNLEEKLESLTQSIRVQKNISLIRSGEIDLDSIKTELSYLIDPVKEKLTIRKSMWEPVVRVYYDYIGSNNFEIVENKLKELLLSGKR
jgi:phosphoglucosamine mutase